MSIEVKYSGGQSRRGEYAVDYMLATVDGIELYAEVPASRDETATYGVLCMRILSQGIEQGIDVRSLRFPYDDAEVL